MLLQSRLIQEAESRANQKVRINTRHKSSLIEFKMNKLIVFLMLSTNFTNKYIQSILLIAVFSVLLPCLGNVSGIASFSIGLMIESKKGLCLYNKQHTPLHQYFIKLIVGCFLLDNKILSNHGMKSFVYIFFYYTGKPLSGTPIRYWIIINFTHTQL